MTATESTSDQPLLVDPTAHRANCGVGVVMDLDANRSHDVVADGLDLLANLEHRGTTGPEENTGDGAGITLQIPHEFFADELPFDLPNPYAVGTVFFPQDPDQTTAIQATFETTVADHGLRTLGWRDVPTDNTELGRTALDSEPRVRQCFLTADNTTPQELDRTLYLARRHAENTIQTHHPDAPEFYICSLDRKLLVYKGLLKGTQLPVYYPDLRDPRVHSTFVLVHARFSTNTLGAWHLAHPYRRIIHNGEFNTIQGNINWMRARETDLESPAIGDIDTIKPVINDPDQSDTASVDNALELLLQGGRSLPHALRMLIPEAWRSPENHVSPERQAWYDFHASLIEPWDGPALVVATDGDRVAALLDRNGLRPCRYELTTSNRLVMASEAGALETPVANVARRGRLQPGQLFLAAPAEGRIIPDDEVFERLTDPQYADWVAAEQHTLETTNNADLLPDEPIDALRAHQAAFGYTHDDIDNLVEPMATQGKDPVGSMGDDTPLAVLSDFNRPLSSYFKQLFAQVSNPPVDNIREELVFSLETRLGHQRNLLEETPAHARQLVLDSPILSDAQTREIKTYAGPRLSTAVVDTTYPTSGSLETAVTDLREATVTAINEGHDIIVLSDRTTDPDHIPIPSLLATSAVHHHLVRNGLRNHVGLVIESGEPHTVHQVATLIGYGAGAINPYLAYQTIEDLVKGPEGADTEEAIRSFIGALEDGLLKVMSKMGISTVASYQGAQIFEAVGLNSGVIDEYFTGTESRIEGIGIAEIEEDTVERHTLGFGDDPELERQGEFEHRSTGIYHQWNPQTVGTLQQAVRSGDYTKYREFAALVNDQQEQLQTLRGLLTFDTDRDPVPIEEVEPIHRIIQRFATASMSLGSLSPEAHENLSIAMNRLGAKSGSGEGGEPPERFLTEKETNIKQVASGRFGVTSNYLTCADVLQIKMAQGSKPGEGGHLPGHKVNEMIAHVRRSVPGVGLISPPPQHDIYSIEDLKQLIHDLKAANPNARINVKLVAEAGVGIIAAGVAKANADEVHISGHSGGTGASPKTSIKHAGIPWELGLSEANQMLRATGLRDRISVTTDGGLKTGRDAVVAALLGAEEYVFGTAGLVAEGCVMARQCHRNTCPVGVATQREELRVRFPGQPEHVINYMTFMAQEFREIMAELGFRTVKEMIGRTDILVQRTDVNHPKARTVDLAPLLADPTTTYDIARYKTREQHHEIDDQLDWPIIDHARDAITNHNPVELDMTITNRDRAVGATLSYEISKRYGEAGLPEDTITVNFDGAAGQSFGAFLQTGVTFALDGIANDYFGKGLSGGKLIIRTPADAPFDPADNTIIGNVALYGGTEGEAYVHGTAGERFAVRNSGVRAVVEGVGDHGCEYMTSGLVVVLGETGKNFAAGMSGGVAYVYDPDDRFPARCNTEMVRLSRDLTDNDEYALRRLVENHAAYTNSHRARDILDEWDTARGRFVKIMPEAYRQAIDDRPEADARLSVPEPAHPPDGAVTESAD